MSSNEELSRQLLKDWVRRRVDAVQSKYSAYDALIEIGVEGISDESSGVHVFCPFHTNTQTPAAYYYPPSGREVGYLRCFACKENWRSISLLAKARGKRFMEALQELERRYHVSIPKRPEVPDYVEPTERGSSYESEGWDDVIRVVKLIETKLVRLRDRCEMSDYIKFCRVADQVSFDFDKLGKSTPEMSAILKKVLKRIDEISYVAELHDETT